MPKTTYCQNCIEDSEDLVPYKDNWVCEKCRKELEEKPPAERKLPEREHTDKTLQARVLQPGERLPEARTCFNFGTPSRGAETGAFALHVGFVWCKMGEE